MAGPQDHRFYGRRHGRPLRRGRRRLVETVLPSLSLSADRPIADLTSLFADPVDEIWMEIGFGGGEHLAAMAADRPDVGFIGSEPYMNGVASLLAMVGAGESRPGNLRIFADDARLLLSGLPDNSLDRVYVMFPDPWPKKRHHRRRFVAPGTLDELARLLRAGGLLRMASDHMGYIRWMLFHVAAHGGFEWQARRPDDWRVRFADSPPTRYESKARADGAACVYLDFCRRPADLACCDAPAQAG